MTILEKKVDAIARYVLANDFETRDGALKELATLMTGPEVSARTAEETTRELLIELGVPEHLVGSKYLIKAICAVVENEDLLNAVTFELYPIVADTYASTKSKVERGIRHAIEVAWDRGDMDTHQWYFGGTISPSKGKPTNSEFIARCGNIVRNKIGRGD